MGQLTELMLSCAYCRDLFQLAECEGVTSAIVRLDWNLEWKAADQIWSGFVEQLFPHQQSNVQWNNRRSNNVGDLAAEMG